MNTGEGEIDHYRLLGDWALVAGRHLQSKQTGYVHYTYNENPPYTAIPLLENALFVLALFRARAVEQAQEAKTLLNGLLGFQNLMENENYGNFPVYLHEFPHCCDPANGLQLLAPFYWILVHFGHVLGTPLKSKLEEAVRLALSHSLADHQRKKFPYGLDVRLAAAHYAFGTLWHIVDWQEAGMRRLEELAARQLEGWASTKHCGDLLVGLQMAYPSLQNSVWEPLWHRMDETWHVPTGRYVGPWLREWQEGMEPRPNLYDLFCGYFSEQFSKRATVLQPIHLLGVLVQPSPHHFAKRLQPILAAGEFKQQEWQVFNAAAYAYTLLEKRESLDPSVDQTMTPFQWIWGDKQRLHSFVCQGGNYDQVKGSQQGSTIELIFDLRPTRTQREIEFFVDFFPGIQFSVNGRSSSTFTLGQEMIINFGNFALTLTYNLIEGEGDFLGHLMRGNRPSQIANHGENRFTAYDWTLFLRTIRRSERCRVRVVIALSHNL